MNDNLERFTKIQEELSGLRGVNEQAAASLILAVVMKEGFAKVTEGLDNILYAVRALEREE